MYSGKCCGGCFLNISLRFDPDWGWWVLKATRCIAYFRMGTVHLPWDKRMVNLSRMNSGSQDYVLSFDRWPRVLMDAKNLTALKVLKHGVLRH